MLEKIRIIDELYTHIVESGKARAIAEHTAEVAHELRQPLTIIGGFARRMAKQLDLNDTNRVKGQAEAVGIISTEIQRLEKILNSLIDYTRPESVSRQMADPNHIIEKVLNLYKEVIGEKNLRLDVVLRSAVGEIFVDPVRFEQVVRESDFQCNRCITKWSGTPRGDRDFDSQYQGACDGPEIGKLFSVESSKLRPCD